jgi:hypothetical protein
MTPVPGSGIEVDDLQDLRVTMVDTETFNTISSWLELPAESLPGLERAAARRDARCKDRVAHKL